MNFQYHQTQICPCGSGETFYYLCTNKTCEHKGFICKECLFTSHSSHSEFCIPIKLFEIEKVSPTMIQEIQSYKQTLIQIQKQLHNLIQDEITFFEELESLNSNLSTNLEKFNLLPVFIYSPRKSKKYTITNYEIQCKIKQLILNHNQYLQKQIQSHFVNMVPQSLKENIMKITQDNIYINDYFGMDENYIVTLKTKGKGILLNGIGFKAKLFYKNSKYDFRLSISSNLGTEMLMVNLNNDVKLIQGYEEFCFVTFNPIYLEKEKNYSVKMIKKVNTLKLKSKIQLYSIKSKKFNMENEKGKIFLLVDDMFCYWISHLIYTDTNQ